MVNILCLIPARSGSKGIKNKNIKNICGFPLMTWTIKQALKSKYTTKNLMRIIVSTDSEEYKKIAIKYGAEVPFLRPKNISEDLSTDYEFIKHAVDWLKINQNYSPDIILQLRPTQPCRDIKLIDECLDLFLRNINEYDSLRTVVPFKKSPYKMYYINKENNNDKLMPLFDKVNNIIEPFNQPRQILPQCYLHNGYIDIIKTSIIIKNNTISGNKILPYIMKETNTIDIDNENDWTEAENKLKQMYNFT